MSKLNEQLKNISNGTTPGLVQFKSMEYEKEFLKLIQDRKNELELEENDELSEEEVNNIFMSFICHKVAAIEIMLNNQYDNLKDLCEILKKE
jgi:hypothetical protein